MSTITISTEVEVDLSEIDDDDLRREFESRGIGDFPDSKDDVLSMYYAFYFGKTDAAMTLARKIAQDVTGKVIP